MKAWIVKPKDVFYSTVVFAETRGKARSLAMATDTCEDTAFTEIEVYRCKEADSQYKGRKEMDWDNPKDRMFLVKELSWHCDYDVVHFDFCKECCAKKYCGIYKDLKECEK